MRCYPLEKCNICPRNCNISRDKSYGFCKSPEDILISKHMLHKWEEPCISGERGAGTVFFSGCNLRCVYCQNKRISRGGSGIPHTDSEILGIIRGLADSGAECIELVTPTHYTKAAYPDSRGGKKGNKCSVCLELRRIRERRDSSLARWTYRRVYA